MSSQNEVHCSALSTLGQNKSRLIPDPAGSSQNQIQRRTYSTASDEEDFFPRETPAARIRRLKAELMEVEADIQASSSKSRSRASASASAQGATGTGDQKRRSVLPPRPPIDLVGELAGLKERLDAVEVGTVRPVVSESDWKAKLERLSEKPSDTSAPVDVPKGHLDSNASLSDIDKRLASLEDLVGPANSSYESVSPFSLCTHVMCREQCSY